MPNLFVDTNCWVYATNPASNLHGIAQRKLSQLSEDYVLCSCPQIIKEYVRVLTSEGVFTHFEIQQKAAFIRQNTTFVSEDNDTVHQFELLIERFAVKGKPVYDCNIVAVMLNHNITTLLTHNIADFSPRYDLLINVLPLT